MWQLINIEEILYDDYELSYELIIKYQVITASVFVHNWYFIYLLRINEELYNELTLNTRRRGSIKIKIIFFFFFF